MKKLISLPILLMMFLALAGVGYGAITCTFDQTATTPGTASTYIVGSAVNLSVTISGWEDSGDNATNATISVSTGTITGALTRIDADGTNATYMNTTVNTLALPDTSTLTYTMTIYNESADSIATCTRDFITDNTVPMVSACTIEGVTWGNTTVTQSSFPFACTIYNSSACNSYWKTTIAHAFATTSQSGTDYQLDAVTFADTLATTGSVFTANLKQAGDDELPTYMDCSDGLNTTTGTLVQLSTEGYSIDQRDEIEGDDGAVITRVLDSLQSTRTKAILFLLLAVFLLLAAAYIYKKKK